MSDRGRRDLQPRWHLEVFPDDGKVPGEAPDAHERTEPMDRFDPRGIDSSYEASIESV